MNPDLKAIFKDKRMLAGVGVAAAVGLVVFIRRSKGGTAGTTTTAGTTAPASTTGYYTGTGTADTTGTDMASFLSGWGQSMLDAVKQQQATETTTDTSTLRSATIREGQDVDAWLKGQGTTMAALVALNPDIAQYVKQADLEGYIGTNNPLDPRNLHNVWNIAGSGGTGTQDDTITVKVK
jgi:hypothetical protein